MAAHKSAPTASAGAPKTKTKITAIVNPAGATLTRLRYAEEADLDGIAKALLHVLIRAADNATGEVRMTQVELARRTGFGERRIRERLPILVDAGYIARTQRQTDARGHPIRDIIVVAELDENGAPTTSRRRLAAVVTPPVAPAGRKRTPPVAPTAGPSVTPTVRPNGRSSRVSRRDRQAVSSSLEQQSQSSTSSQTPNNSNLLRAFIDSKMKERPADDADLNRKSASPQPARRLTGAGRKATPQPRSARRDLEQSRPATPTGAGNSNSGALEEIHAELADIPWSVLGKGIVGSGHEEAIWNLGFRFPASHISGQPPELAQAPHWHRGEQDYNPLRAPAAELEWFETKRRRALKLLKAREAAAA